MDQSMMDNAARCRLSPKEGTWSMPLSRDLTSEQIMKFWSPTTPLVKRAAEIGHGPPGTAVKVASHMKGRLWVSSFPLEIRDR